MTRKSARRGASPEGLAGIEEALGHRFGDAELVRQALTHRSYGSPHSERLEFLGDAVLGAAVASLLYEQFGAMNEGDLTRIRASLVKEPTLSEIATEMGLGPWLRLGEGELKSGGFRRPSILADAVEALLGAVYLDGGFAAARASVARLLGERINDPQRARLAKDAKTTLQEHLQGAGLPVPRYEVRRTEGEAHDQLFVIECIVEKLGLTAEGRGPSRKVAEQAAAQAMLQQIEKLPKKRKA